MWRFDATPRRVAAPYGDVPGPVSPAAVARHERAASTLPAGHERRLEVVVASGLDAPTTARAVVAAWLSPQVGAAVLDDVQLLVSERVEVEDPGDVAILARPPDREHGGGFGLYLVETLAQRWGSWHEGTTRVWAELAIARAA